MTNAPSVLRRIGVIGLFAAAATAIWLPCLHLLFRQKVGRYYAPTGIPDKARALSVQYTELWSDPAAVGREIAKMRGSNAEWDFMGRTFFVLSLANMALREPSAKPSYLAIMDKIIDETLRLERERGVHYFLMDYSRASPFVLSGGRSLFEDGEISLMLGARRMVEEKPEYRSALSERVAAMTAYMQKSQVLCGESYPDECWMFCNAAALVSIRMADVLDGSDHSSFLRRWTAMAKNKLVDPATGLLVSSFTADGGHLDGPEGSSIWMVAHCLQAVDPAFAEDQYRRAKRELARRVLGFGYAREWPVSWNGAADVDSGPIIPVLEISAGSSGLAFVGAAAFGDRDFLEGLLTSLRFGGFPVERGGRLRYCAGNPVGDAVLLYSTVLGPLWREMDAKERREERQHEAKPDA